MPRARSHAAATGALARDRFFNVQCKLEVTGEVHQLKNVHNEMKIRALKSHAEFATGIPMDMQRLCYLDEGDLIDDSDLRYNDIVPGALIHMKVWSMWRSLVEAVATNDANWVFKLGVTADSKFTTPNSEFMKSINPRMKKQWLADRAFVALYIAAHRGHQKLCEKLIQSGANVNASTPLGRSALHMAAAKGHGHIVDLLLEKGADINAEDKSGETPLTIAAKYGNKDCERHLFMFRWQQRAKKVMKTKVHVDMFAHQYHDSALPVWLKSDHGQVYYTQILPPGEFEGTALSAPKRRSTPGSTPSSGIRREGSKADSMEDDSSCVQDKDEKRGQLGGMPPIREEQNLVHQMSHSYPENSRTLTAASQANLAVSFIEKNKPEKSFDKWLAKKKSNEELRRKAKKQQEATIQEVEEESSSFLL